MSTLIDEPHRADDDPTAELPTLSEVLVQESRRGGPRLLDAAQLEDGARPQADEELDHCATATYDAAAYDAEPMQDAALSEREGMLEQRLAERETEIVALMRQVGALRAADQERRRTEERLVTKLAHRSSEVQRLLDEIRRERLRIDELQEQLRTEQENARAARSELEQARLQVFHWRLLAREESMRGRASARAARATAPGVVVRYIANAMAWWQDMRARIDAHRRHLLRIVAELWSTYRSRESAGSGKRE